MNSERQDYLPQPYPAYTVVQPEDEVNLVDIWLTLANYRKVFWAFFLLTLMIGGGFTFGVFKEKYSLVTMVQIGSVENANERHLLEPPESLVSKIENSIIPRQTNNWMVQTGYPDLFATDAAIPEESEVVTIANKVKENEIETFTDFQKGVAEIIVDDHRRIINSLKAGLISQLEVAQLKLEELKNPLTLNTRLKTKEIELDSEGNKLKRLQDEKFFGIKKNEFKNQILAGEHELELSKKTGEILKQQLNRIQETKEILAKSIAELKAQIKDSRENRRTAQENATELSAMSQLLIDNEIQQNNTRLQALEERYYVTLENDKSEILKKVQVNSLNQVDIEKRNGVLKQKYDQLLFNNQLQVEQQQLVIEKVKLDIENLKLNHQNQISERLQKIKEIETRLENFDETRIVSEPVPSLSPEGMTRTKLMAVFVFLSAFTGFAAMLMALFFDKVKQRRIELAS